MKAREKVFIATEKMILKRFQQILQLKKKKKSPKLQHKVNSLVLSNHISETELA